MPSLHLPVHLPILFASLPLIRCVCFASQPLAPAVVALLRAHGQDVDRYLLQLAEEQERGSSPAQNKGSHGKPTPAQADRKATAAELSSDEEVASSGQRWLASRLVSPITGQVNHITTNDAAAAADVADATD